MGTSQIRTAAAEPTTFITERRVQASVIAKRVNAVFALNGDYCGDFHGYESTKYILRQGTVFRDTVDERLDISESDFEIYEIEVEPPLVDEDGREYELVEEDKRQMTLWPEEGPRMKVRRYVA